VIEANSVARAYAVIGHTRALAAFIGIPLGHILGSLAVWLVKRKECQSVDDHGKEALNFQISMTIYGIVAGIRVILLIGIALLALVAIVGMVLTTIASMDANDGQRYMYPFTIRFIK
jgi:uncharacterized protein